MEKIVHELKFIRIKLRHVNVYQSVAVLVDCKLTQTKPLSLKAFGLHIFLRGLPGNWKFHYSDLAERLKMGRTTLINLTKELVAHELLIIKSLRDERGRIVRWDWHLYDVPKNEHEKMIKTKWIEEV